MSTCTELRKPIRLAVIQMAKLGDSIQSLMALRAAKQLYPELEVTFITHERYSEAVNNTSWIEEVVCFPTEELIGPILAGKKTSAESLASAATWLEPLVERPFD